MKDSGQRLCRSKGRLAARRDTRLFTSLERGLQVGQMHHQEKACSEGVPRSRRPCASRCRTALAGAAARRWAGTAAADLDSALARRPLASGSRIRAIRQQGVQRNHGRGIDRHTGSSPPGTRWRPCGSGSSASRARRRRRRLAELDQALGVQPGVGIALRGCDGPRRSMSNRWRMSRARCRPVLEAPRWSGRAPQLFARGKRQIEAVVGGVGLQEPEVIGHWAPLRLRAPDVGRIVSPLGRQRDVGRPDDGCRRHAVAHRPTGALAHQALLDYQLG